MIRSLITAIAVLCIAALLTGCAATVHSANSQDTDYYEGCQGRWEEIRMCAEEKKKESHEKNLTEDTKEISPNEMAVIVDSYWGSSRYSKAGIFGVNGTSLNFKERVKVPPGKHSVSIYCAHGYGLGSQLYATIKIVEFIAEPGHKYQVKCSEKKGHGLKIQPPMRSSAAQKFKR